MNKKKINYMCPYCNKKYADDNWTEDHIIPRAIGGTISFKIVSCLDCNNMINLGIEQPALQTLAIGELFGNRLIEGYHIKSRRKNKKVYMHKKIGFSGGMAAKMYYDLQKREHVISLQGCLPGFPKVKDIKKITQAIIPIDQPKENDSVLLSKLTNKIIYGSCIWLWSNKFLESKCADLLRKRMWEVTDEDIIKLQPHDKHYSVEIKEKSQEKGTIREEDALNNSPSHSIAILNNDKIIYGILNLFGELEMSTLIGKKEEIPNIDIGGGVVIISSTTENKIKKMGLKEYESFKEKELLRK